MDLLGSVQCLFYELFFFILERVRENKKTRGLLQMSTWQLQKRKEKLISYDVLYKAILINPWFGTQHRISFCQEKVPNILNHLPVINGSQGVIVSILTHSLTPRRYNLCRVLADSRSRLQTSLSLALILQFLTPNLSASLITPAIHLRFGLPTRLVLSGLSKLIFLHGRLSCIDTICPAHLSPVILIVVTKSISSYRRYSSSLYLDFHVTPSQIGP